MSASPDPNPEAAPNPPPQPRGWRRYLGSLVLFVVLVVGITTVMGKLRAPRLPEVAPAFALANLDGETVRLEELRGQTVVLNFWATWCPPCRLEIPSFSKFARKHGDVPVLGIAVDGSREQLIQAKEDMGIDYPVLIADPETLAAYGVRSLPTTVIVGADGKVRSAHAGILTGPQLWWMTR
ncbi:MAG: TlpA disulfide reductase family protein [Acidobacteriota bacterium]